MKLVVSSCKYILTRRLCLRPTINARIQTCVPSWNICHTHITYVRLPRWFAIVIKRVDVFVKANNVSQHFRFTQCKLTLLLPAGIRPIYLLLNVLHRIHENVKFLNVKELSSFSFLIPEGNSHCGEDNSEVVKIHFMKIFFNLLQLHALLICSHSRGKDFQ